MALGAYEPAGRSTGANDYSLRGGCPCAGRLMVCGSIANGGIERCLLFGMSPSTSLSPTISPHSRMSFNGWFGYHGDSTTKIYKRLQAIACSLFSFAGR